MSPTLRAYCDQGGVRSSSKALVHKVPPRGDITRVISPEAIKG
ncbi:MAG: hypothetical protein ACI9K5_003323 [Gammaproteobacteria bacterium]|jgi:hypothetical protein